jgi:putative ABC transport system permease protein
VPYKRDHRSMFLRLVADSFTRRPRRKVLTAAALSLGMAVVTAALSVSLDVGDRLASEFRSLGANLLVTPQADSLPLEIGGVDYRPVNAGAYLPEADLPKIKTVFWHNNIIAFSPSLEVQVNSWTPQFSPASAAFVKPAAKGDAVLIGAWSNHEVRLSDGGSFVTGLKQTSPWWSVDGAWFNDAKAECIVGKNFAKKNAVLIDSPVYLEGPISGQGLALTVTGIYSSGGAEDDGVVAPLSIVQKYLQKPGQYRRLEVSALTKPEDDFARRDPKTMKQDEFERWSCSPYVSSIAYSIKQVLPGTDVRVIRRVAEGEGTILTRVRALLWMVTFASLLAAALAVGASAAASVIERRTEIGLMKALGAGAAAVGFLLAAEQLVLAFVGGGIGYSLGTLLARLVGQKIFGVAPAPSVLVLVAVLALAAGVTLLGSAIPLRRASRYEPAPILRGE